MLLSGGGSGQSDVVGSLLAQRYFATVSLLDSCILIHAAEMVLHTSSGGGRVAVAVGAGSLVRTGGMRWFWDRLEGAPEGVGRCERVEVGDEGVIFAMDALARAFGKCAANCCTCAPPWAGKGGGEGDRTGSETHVPIRVTGFKGVAAADEDGNREVIFPAAMEAETLLRLWRVTVLLETSVL